MTYHAIEGQLAENTVGRERRKGLRCCKNCSSLSGENHAQRCSFAMIKCEKIHDVFAPFQYLQCQCFSCFIHLAEAKEITLRLTETGYLQLFIMLCFKQIEPVALQFYLTSADVLYCCKLGHDESELTAFQVKKF